MEMIADLNMELACLLLVNPKSTNQGVERQDKEMPLI